MKTTITIIGSGIIKNTIGAPLVITGQLLGITGRGLIATGQGVERLGDKAIVCGGTKVLMSTMTSEQARAQRTVDRLEAAQARAARKVERAAYAANRKVEKLAAAKDRQMRLGAEMVQRVANAQLKLQSHSAQMGEGVYA